MSGRSCASTCTSLSLLLHLSSSSSTQVCTAPCALRARALPSHHHARARARICARMTSHVCCMLSHWFGLLCTRAARFILRCLLPHVHARDGRYVYAKNSVRVAVALLFYFAFCARLSHCCCFARTALTRAVGCARAHLMFSRRVGCRAPRPAPRARGRIMFPRASSLPLLYLPLYPFLPTPHLYLLLSLHYPPTPIYDVARRLFIVLVPAFT